MSTEVEKSRNRKGLSVTIATHAIVILLCGLVSCWEQPDPFVVPGEIGVVFGNSSVGSGKNTEPADNPVEKPTEETQTPTPSASSEEVTQAVTDDDSDLIPQEISPNPTTPKTTSTTTKNTTQNTSTQTDTKPKTDPKSMMGGTEGNGNDGKAGQQGDPNGGKTGMTEGQGGTGTGTGGAPGDGDGLKMDGWAFAKKPETKEIKNTGTATIDFTIDRNGNVTNCIVKSPSFTVSEMAIIKEKFIAEAKFKKLTGNDAKLPFYKGIFVWEFTF